MAFENGHFLRAKYLSNPVKSDLGTMKKETLYSKAKQRVCHSRRPCLMAYTLNNQQPVICTIVADQPYFYMEEQNLYEEDDLLLAEELAMFDAEIKDMKRKMSAYERTAKSYERDPERRLNDFADAMHEIASGPSGEINSIPALEEKLSQSRMAKELLIFAKSNGVSLVASDQADTAYFDREAARILIHPGLAETEALLMSVRELRRHWQHKNGALINPLTFHPDHAVFINRAQMADLSVAMVRAAWEMQLAGDRAAWDYIENSAMSDLGRAFAREALVDFRSLASGKASSAVFETWFLSERSRHQDKKLIQSMLADHQGYVFTCPEASRSVSIELVSALGSQPFGKNYLAPYAQNIIADPVFTEVRDRSNANFLWFIKFERSFQEAEQSLQGDERTILSEGATLSPNHPQGSKDEYETASVIIQHPRSGMFAGNSNAEGSFGCLEKGHEGANVIHVAFGNAKSL